jgi:hypothetical protein
MNINEDVRTSKFDSRQHMRIPLNQEFFNVMGSSQHHSRFSSQSFWKRGSERNGLEVEISI